MKAEARLLIVVTASLVMILGVGLGIPAILTIVTPEPLPRLAGAQHRAIWRTWEGPREIGRELALQPTRDEEFRINAAAMSAAGVAW